VEGLDARRVIADRCRVQAGWCERLGSPLYADLLRHGAEDVESGGPLWEVLRERAEEPEEFYSPLRLMGSVHRLVLQGRAPALAPHYPSVGGRPGPGTWEAFRATVADRKEELVGLLSIPPQTNEVGRSASLLGGFLELAAARSLPLRLLEVGASAGLNLRWDRYRYESRGWAWGDAASPVRFVDVFEGDSAPPRPGVHVVERSGCDLEPIDPRSEDGRITLLSYVWPDQMGRIARLRAALRVAAGVDATIDRAEAGAWLQGRLERPAGGAITVVFHSVVLGYVEEEARRSLIRTLEAAGGRATQEAPLAWLSMERAGDRFEVRLRTWPGGKERLLAVSGPHGPPVRWREHL
jgi:hypothetical protein